MSMDDGVAMLGGNAQNNAGDHMDIRETVQMMPQDEVRSEHDLGFMTEVDAEYKGNVGKQSSATGEVNSTRHSEVGGNTDVPQRQSSLLSIEKAEFKQVIKELISKE